ncbi:MAG: hypothetical protein H0T46_18955 [Deltaproteobacteria bacterium]|nr:hypothetical protein [Deltaproteobacteria bacterium]
MRLPLACALILAACGDSSTMEPAPDAAAGSPDAPVSGAAPSIPAPTGACPALVAGDVTFAPAGIPPRKVKLAFDATKASDKGELVLYWHATGSGVGEAAYALGATHTDITSRGGIVAAPYSDDAAGQFEWYAVNGSAKPDDFLLADEIVACLAAAKRIDPKHVHSMGMSAGALQTTALSFLRSSYIASVATYSGGMLSGFDPALQNPANKFAALIFAGGPSDAVFGVDFKAASEAYRARLDASGHFARICDHGNGHKIPLDAAPSVAAFFTANPYGAWPSPYAAGLPASFPAYCKR